MEQISEHVNGQPFATWFKPIRPISSNDETIELEVPNSFFLEWIKEHYLTLIFDALRHASKKSLTVAWKINTEMPRLAVAKKSSAREDLPKLQKQSYPTLNSKYTFDNFVVGKANEFAHAACFSVSKNLGKKYNPLFIYGGTGLGKTHLLQGIGHKVLTDNPLAKICYYSSEQFMNDFINHVKRQKMSEFRSKFRNTDVLLIDDIQFWAKKEGTQEEFFHTFNSLYESHKQIVVTSDRMPKDIDGLEERLRSRFEWGLLADIQQPDTETKIAILYKKAQDQGIKLPDDVAEWLASVSGSNIRDLEGFLNRIVAEASFTNKEITLAMSKDALKNMLKKVEDKHITVEEIQKAVAQHFSVKLSDLKSKRRHRTIAFPRQIAMYLSREYGKFSFPEIGTSFGGKDHSTAIHAVKKIEKEIKEKLEVKSAVKQIKQKLGFA